MITAITGMGIIVAATVIHITMTIIVTRITILTIPVHPRLREGEAGSLSRWVEILLKRLKQKMASDAAIFVLPFNQYFFILFFFPF